MNRTMLMLGLLVSLALVACDKKEGGAEGAGESPVAMTDEAVDQVAVPVKEDFEEAAQSSINEDNVEAEIDRLEKEIGGDSP